MGERVAVVTGGSSGIGAEVARLLVADGWRCVLVARNEERLRALADELGAEAEVCDVGDPAAVDALAQRVRARHPRIELLVNNAGIPGKADFLTGEPERIENVMRINYFGAIWCLRAFLPALEAAAPADVVNVVSVAGTVALPPSGPYAASKHAQLAFSRAVAAQLRPRRIRVHTILPGFSRTEGFPEPSVLPRTLEWTVIPVERIARTIVRAVARDKRESFVPWWFRGIAILQGSLPGIFSRGLAWFSGRFVRS
ncbi:MAG TPA: SDR family oxidoreductase [Gaiellaceae bacterium]|nr:SDR family oxidoreductase [Gaiellaceae bacterium]